MTECPYCHQKAMSQLGKACLGPARTTTCRSCGKRISVSWKTMLELVPFAIGGLLIPVLSPAWYAYVPVVLGAAIMFLIHARCIPLVKRDG